MKNLQIAGLILLSISTSCKKYLDKVPDKSLSVLTEISQYQQLIDNQNLYQQMANLTEFGADNFYLLEKDWNSRVNIFKNAYTWEKDIYEGNDGQNQDWSYPYSAIYYSNVLLEGLTNIKPNSGEISQYNNIKAQGLFLRAFSHYQLTETYGQPFRPASASTDLGIPLRLSQDLTVTVQRTSVQQTYKQIMDDLKQALNLCSPAYQSTNRIRPSKAMIHAMLSRVYLAMQDYNNCRSHADSSLNLYSKLIDYNSLSTSSNAPFPFPDNEEVLFAAKRLNGSYIFSPTCIIDSNLYRSYSDDDLRKTLFFALSQPAKTPYLKAMYSGSAVPFVGLATDEVLLNRAECLARAGNTIPAMDDLNALLLKRFKTGKFTALTANSPDEALTLILTERRKELLFRGIRWTDLRRLNQDEKTAVTLKRNIAGKEYLLTPNDPKYTYPIPQGEIQLSGIQQNIR